MADLYSVITGIQPDQQDIVEAELLAKQILEAQFPDIDLREGTGIRDLVLRPSAFLLAMCKKGFDYYFEQNTLANVDDTSPTELVDNILGNLFLTRNLGSQAIINVRLYFARQKAVTLTTTTSFSTDGTLLFYPQTTTTYSDSTLQFDAFNNEYYLDIDLIAADKGTEYNIGSGSLLYFTNFDPYFLHAEINYLGQASINPESNTEFVGRAQTAISTRNLINKPSIDNVLRQTFNYVPKVAVVGAGDPEIYRDQVEVAGSVGASRTGSSLTLTDSDTKAQIGLTSHGFVVGQLVNVIESGGGSVLVLKRVAVSVVVDANTFKVDLPITVAPRSFAVPLVSAVEEDIFIHQGGMVDVHCSDEVQMELAQYTLDGSGKVEIEGPIYKLVRSTVSATEDPDTVPGGASFTVTFPGHTSRSDVSLAYGSSTVNLIMRSHCLVVGRMVKVAGWPQSNSINYWMVTEVVDQDSVRLGKGITSTAIGGGLTPIVTYVYPSKDTGFSERQTVVLDFGGGQAGGLASMEVYSFKNLQSIQTFLELADNRVLCGDLLGRGFDIVKLDFTLSIYDTALPAQAQVASLITTFLSGLAPGAELIEADLVTYLAEQGGIERINKGGTGVTYSYYTKDLFPAVTGTITNAFKPDNSSTVFILNDVTISSATLV